MARIAYPAADGPETTALRKRIASERGKVLNLYAMLLHSPPVAEGWLAFLTAIRQKSILPDRIRELVILHIAVRNRAPYEFEQHVPFALRAGVSEAQIASLKDGSFVSLTAEDQAALKYADAMTTTVQVAQNVFDVVRSHFSEREIVELTATVGAYNLVSRFLEALQIDHD